MSREKSTATLTILIAPLDWGLGHATRVIPLARYFLEHNCDIIFAATGAARNLLKREFPDLRFVDYPDYNIRYYRYMPAYVAVLLQLPKFLWRLWREYYRLRRLIRAEHVDALVSDNRYALFNRDIPCAFISHQQLIKLPFFSKYFEVWTWLAVAFFARKYSFNWLPDYPAMPRLSGDLGHRFPLAGSGRYLGPLVDDCGNETEACDVLISISGPEPHRSGLRQLIVQQLTKLSGLHVVFLLGDPQASLVPQVLTGMQVHNHLPRRRLLALMRGARLLLCRSGYTTVMEAALCATPAIWVATPGQTEQEYLSSYLPTIGFGISRRQKGLDLAEIRTHLQNPPPVPDFPRPEVLLKKALGEFLTAARQR
jgi:UDP:flavonoid glycosyltransferase YjiC (YdhE family)